MKYLLTAAFILTTSAAYAERTPECAPSDLGCTAAQQRARSIEPASAAHGTPDTPGEPSSKGNNGHGNGDQDPPGNSGSHNNAENSEHSGQGNSGNGKGGHKF